MKNPSVSIIILNWNGWKDTIECLESLYQINYPNYNVIVVDNGSEDESVQKIREYTDGKIEVKSKFFEYNQSNKPIKILENIKETSENKKNMKELSTNKKLILIKNEKNYGFAEGSNIGINYAMNHLNPEYICLLNNDTVVDKRWLNALVKEINPTNKIGFCSSKILYYDNETTINSTGILILRDGTAMDRGRNEIDQKQYDGIRETFGACAAASIYSVESLKEVGLFDKDYFAYCEDVDLSWRLQLAGWKCIYVPTAIVYHKYSKSGGRFSLFKVYHGERNRIWNVIKNFTLFDIFLSFPYNLVKKILLFYTNLRGTGRGTGYTKKYSLFQIFITLRKADLNAWSDIKNLITKRQNIKHLRKVSKKEIKEWFTKYSVKLKRVPYM